MNIHNFGNEPEKPFHSSTYAEVANGGSIGSTNSQTFGQRYGVDQNRQSIRRYKDSHIGRGALRYQARRGITDPFGRVDPAAAHSPLQGQNTTGSLGKPVDRRSAPPAAPRTTFREPPTRGFNPYS